MLDLAPELAPAMIKLGGAAALAFAAIGSALGTGTAAMAGIGAWKKCYLQGKPAPFILLVFIGAPLSQTIYGLLLLLAFNKMALLESAVVMWPAVLGAGIIGGIAMVTVMATLPAHERETELLDLILARPIPRASYLSAAALLVLVPALLTPFSLLAGGALGLAVVEAPSPVLWSAYIPAAGALGRTAHLHAGGTGSHRLPEARTQEYPTAPRPVRRPGRGSPRPAPSRRRAAPTRSPARPSRTP